MPELDKIFNKDGSFKLKGFDPYRSYEENREFRDLIFNDDGSVRWEIDQKLDKFIKDNNCSPFSDIVQLMWAEHFGSNTKGSYPAVYSWR